VVALAVRMATYTRDIYCTCGRWLAQVDTIPGHRQRLRLGRCPDCHRNSQPATPIVFVREDGCYTVVKWRGRVEPQELPWPQEGYQ
jgi:hypothetical protein